MLGFLDKTNLDAALACGADPGDSAALAHRAASLTRGRDRGRLVAWIEEIFARTSRPPGRRGLQIDPDREEVWEAAEPFGEIRDQLASAAPLRPQGVAMIARLLSDGGSALYRPAWSGELRYWLERALGAMQAPRLVDPPAWLSA